MKYKKRKNIRTRKNSIKKSCKNRTKKIKGGLDFKNFLPILFATVVVAFRPLNTRYTITKQQVTSKNPTELLSPFLEDEIITELKTEFSSSWPKITSVSNNGGGGVPPSNNIKVVMSDPDDPHNENKNQETEVTTADVMEMVGITPEKLLKNYNKDIKKTYIKKELWNN